MNRILITLLTAMFVAGFSATAFAGHHEEGEKAHAECTHAADEPCPHAADGTCPHVAKSDDEGEAKQCTKHAEGEPCDCHGKDEGDHGAHG